MKNHFKKIILLMGLLVLPLFIFDGQAYGAYLINDKTGVVVDIGIFFGNLGVATKMDYSTAEISGIFPRYTLSNGYGDCCLITRINNESFRSKSYADIANLINNKEIYSFSTVSYGDIYVYEFPSRGKEFYTNFYKNISIDEVPSQIMKNDISDEILQINRKNELYDKYFDIDYDNFKISNKSFSSEEKKQLKKANKSEYEKISKMQKYLKNWQYEDAIALDKDFLPIYLFIYQNSLKSYKYGNTLFALKKLKEINGTQNIFNEKVIDYQIGLLYLIFSQYDQAYSYLKEFAGIAATTKNQYLSHALGMLHFKLGNYSTSIFYEDQVKSDSSWYTAALKNIITNYQKLNNKSKEKEYIAKLISVEPTVDLYLRYIEFFTNKNDKLQLYYKARGVAKNANEASNVNWEIIDIEQEKINNSVKNYSRFIEVPNWRKYNSHFSYSTQDEFFAKSNDCIKRYNGTNLEKCFTSIIKYYDDKLMINQNEQFKNQYIEKLREIESELNEANRIIRNYNMSR